MRTPNAPEATGYDILVWVDEDGDIVAKAFTKAGVKAMRNLTPEYRSGDVAVLFCDPQEMLRDVGDVSVATFTELGTHVLSTLRLH